MRTTFVTFRVWVWLLICSLEGESFHQPALPLPLDALHDLEPDSTNRPPQDEIVFLVCVVNDSTTFGITSISTNDLEHSQNTSHRNPRSAGKY